MATGKSELKELLAELAKVHRKTKIAASPAHLLPSSPDDLLNLPLPQGFARLKPPGHVGAIYEGMAEKFSVASAFVATSIRQGGRALIVGHEAIVAGVAEELKAAGVDPAAVRDAGQLLVVPREDLVAVAHEAPARLAQECEQAATDGYATLWVVLEPGFLPGAAGSTAALREFGAKVDQELFPHRPVIILSLFSYQSLSPALLRQILQTCHFLAYGGRVFTNLCRYPLEEFLPAVDPEFDSP